MKQQAGKVLVAFSALMLLVSPAWAEIEFFGTAKIKPTFYSNFDFDDNNNDAFIINEGGLTGDQHMRAELRLGWLAKGDKWSVKMIAEADVIMEKDTADRSYYVGSVSKEGKPNSGAEFGIERVELLYRFFPWLELQTGWDVRALDIQTGGLLFGDDHPFLGFRGDLTNSLKYELLYMPIQNRTSLPSSYNTDKVLRSPDADDWRVYTLKVTQSFGGQGDALPQSAIFGNSNGQNSVAKINLSPIYAFSDNDSAQAKIHYFGLEATGQFGWFKPYFEVVAAEGEFDNRKDISSWALFAGLEMAVNKAFNPYVAFRYTQGDDDKDDDDVEGWVGVGDIGRFTPLMGMDGNILGEDLGQSYGATLYSYSPERFYGTDPTKRNNLYGGIGNGGSGDNPGQKLIAVGTRGDLSALLPNLMYKSQAFFIWYDDTANLEHKSNSDKKVDDYAGTTFDLQLLYAFSKNFSVDYIFSAFVPGGGIKDQYGDDTAFVNALTLAWTY